ncbi:hypothetical protein I4100191B2_11330 [Clostridiales bacterium]
MLRKTSTEAKGAGGTLLKNKTAQERLSTVEGQITPAWFQVQKELTKWEVGLGITGHMTVERSKRADGCLTERL